MNELIELERKVSENLDDYRMAHTRSVKNECIRLAELFELRESDATCLVEAALLHDCTKPLKYAKQLQLASSLGVSLTEDDLSSPAVLHSITGAAYAKTHFHSNEAVSHAIACHTTGKENMSVIEKLLFLADYIEPTRTFDDCVQVRSFFYDEAKNLSLSERLDATLLLAFDLTIQQLIADKRPIHPTTIKSRNFLLKKS